MSDDLFAAARALGSGDYPEAVACLRRELADASRAGDQVRLLQVAQLAESLRGKPGVDEREADGIARAAREGTVLDLPEPPAPPPPPPPLSQSQLEVEVPMPDVVVSPPAPDASGTPWELGACPRCGGALVAEARCTLLVSGAIVADGTISNVEYEGEPQPTEVIALRCANGHELGAQAGRGRLRWLGD